MGPGSFTYNGRLRPAAILVWPASSTNCAADEAARARALKIIEEANTEALRRMLAGDPVLVDVVPAAQALPGLAERTILHAGPPVGWERMCGPMRGAVMGIAVF